jgi:lipooligosaccharide transport system permease protein
VASHPVLRVVEREIRVYRRLWRGLAFSSFLAPVLFLAAMGVGLGDLVDENTGPVEGLDYVAFVAPGLLVANAAQIAASEALWPVMAGTKWVRFYHGIVASPVGAPDVYAGHVVFNALRSMLAAAAFLLVAAGLGGVGSWWGVLAVPSAALCAAACTAPLAAFAASQESDVAFPVIMRLVVMPLFLFSGTFFPVEQLPRLLELAATASPLYHGVELARAATTGRGDALAATVHVAVLLAFAAAGWRWGTRTFTRRLTA